MNNEENNDATQSVQQKLNMSQSMMQHKIQQKLLQQMKKKNMTLALILSFFFGPLGLFYATVKGGAIMLGISIILHLTIGVGIFFTWIPCMICAYVAVDNYNKELTVTNESLTQ